MTWGFVAIGLGTVLLLLVLYGAGRLEYWQQRLWFRLWNQGKSNRR
jgi:hypothetical protein